MPFLPLGEAKCPARQPFDPGPEMEVLARYLLGVALTPLVPARIEVTLVSSPVIREITGSGLNL